MKKLSIEWKTEGMFIKIDHKYSGMVKHRTQVIFFFRTTFSMLYYLSKRDESFKFVEVNAINKLK